MVPPANARLVPPGVRPVAFFSEPLNATSVTPATAWLTTADASVTYAATPRTATLTPTSALDAGVDYTFNVLGVRDLAGNTQTVPATAPFRTAALPVPISVDQPPAHGGPIIKFTEGGAGLVVWTIDRGNTTGRVAYATYSPTTQSWSAAQLLDSSNSVQDVVVSGERFAISHVASGGPSTNNVSVIHDGARTNYSVGVSGAVRLAANATRVLAFWGATNGTSAQVFDTATSTWSAPTVLSTQVAWSAAASSTGFTVAFSNGTTLNAQSWSPGTGWTGLVQIQGSLVGGSIRAVALASQGVGFALGYVMDFTTTVSIYAKFSSGTGSWTTPASTGAVVGAYSLGMQTYQASYTLGLSSDGTSYMAAWRECHVVSTAGCSPRLMTRRYLAGNWQAAVAVSTGNVPGTNDPIDVLGNPSGGYVAVWRDGPVHGAYAAGGGTSWTASTLLGTGAPTWARPQVVARGTGFTVAWQTVSMANDVSACQARTLTGGAWDPSIDVASAPPTLGTCSVAAKGSDSAFAYAQDSTIWTRELAATTLGTATERSQGLAVVATVERGRLALAGDGTAYAAWIQFDRGVQSVFGAHRAANGTWSAPVKLGAPGYDVRVVGEGSTYLVAWSHDTGLFSRTIVAGSAPSAVTTLATTPVDWLDAASGGGFMLAWGRRSGFSQVLEAAASADGLTFAPTSALGISSVSRFRLVGRGGRFVLGLSPTSGAPRAATYASGTWSPLTALGTTTLNDWGVATNGTTAILAGAAGMSATAHTFSGASWTSQAIPTVGVGTFDHVRLGVTAGSYVAVVNGGSSSFVSWLGPSSWSSRSASFSGYVDSVPCDVSGCTAVVETSSFGGAVIELHAVHALGATPLGTLVPTSAEARGSTMAVSTDDGRWGVLFTARDAAADRDRIFVHVDP